MTNIKVKFASNNYGGPSPLEVPESDIEYIKEIGGLERFFGFKEYKKAIQSGEITENDKIIIPNGFHNPDQSIIYNLDTFLAKNEKALKTSYGSIEYNPRKELKGIHWYLNK